MAICKLQHICKLFVTFFNFDIWIPHTRIHICHRLSRDYGLCLCAEDFDPSPWLCCLLFNVNIKINIPDTWSREYDHYMDTVWQVSNMLPLLIWLYYVWDMDRWFLTDIMLTAYIQFQSRWTMMFSKAFLAQIICYKMIKCLVIMLQGFLRERLVSWLFASDS